MSTRQEFKFDDGQIKYDSLSEDARKHLLLCNKPRKNVYLVLLLSVALIQFGIICILIVRSTQCQSSDQDIAGSSQQMSAQHVAQKSTVIEPEPINSLCFPCAEIGRNITENDFGDIIKLDKKTNMCCMQDVGNLKKLFLLIVNEYYRNVKNISTNTDTNSEANDEEKDSDEAVGPVAGYVGGSEQTTKAPSKPKPLSFWKKREIAAHLFLDNDILKHSNETAPRIPWDGRDYHNLSMTSHLLTYDPEKRSIKVIEHGLYFIYSSVTLQAPASDLNAQVYHMLLREHYLLPETGATIMMMNKYGGGKQSSGFYTSFLCGTFKLRRGDELFVKVSNSSFMYHLYYSNYFGLYRLSSF
ncbi:uncharacterized protein LOC132550553 [Ylistrum balloti]|uniref:uncharacterized protein LOC132550553 n=1 Tax=Ylistrum balloti TaxID=509963 RepID=UPI002905A196|nr:uncharacterized protein LOC132550553 [Ylistrum balloti]